MSNTLSRNRVREFLPNNWGDVDTLLNQVFGSRGPDQVRGSFARASLWEDDSGYHLEIDLPGVRRDDVEITLDKGELTVAAERKGPEAERTGAIEERHFGRVERSVRLPETVDPDSVNATLTDGVLLVNVAKKPEAQPKRIEIK